MIVFGQTEVSDGYVELIRVLGGHGLIGVILGVVAIFGLLCLTAVWTIRKIAGDTILAQSQQIKDLAVSVGAVNVKIDENEKADVKHENLLAEHDARLDNHEVRIVKLEADEVKPRKVVK